MIDPEFPDAPASTGEPFLAWVEKRRVEDERVETLRDNTLRWWFSARRTPGAVYRLGWTAPTTRQTSGTLVVRRVSAPRSDERNP